MQHDFLAETMEVDLLPAFIEYLDAVYFHGYADYLLEVQPNQFDAEFIIFSTSYSY